METRSDKVGAAVALGVSLAATIAFARLVCQRAYFRGDDYLGFYSVVTLPLRELLLMPIDVHFLPLHRLSTWLSYRTAPLDFAVTVGVMSALHLAGLWMLYRVLRLLGAGRLSAPLTALCATNLYFAVLLMWWTAGIARFPYILLTLVAIYHYLVFRRTGSWARVAVVAACVAGACAFFSKGLLIAGYLGALEVVLLPETSRRELVRNLGVVVIAAGVAVAYRLLGNAFVSTAFQAPTIDWGSQLFALQLASLMLCQGIAGVLVTPGMSVANWLVVVAWLAFAVVTIVRDRFNVVVWLVGLATLAVNFLVITLSPRMVMGPVVVLAERYYFDVMFLVVLFVAIALRRSARDAGGIVMLAWCVVALSGWSSWQSFHRLLESPGYDTLPFVRKYTSNLRTDLAAIRRMHPDTLDFVDGDVPRSLLGMAAMKMGRQSTFLLVFDPAIRIVPHGRCLYAVRPDGTVAHPPPGCAG